MKQLILHAFLLALLIALYSPVGYCQPAAVMTPSVKPVLDTSVFSRWLRVQDRAAISNDGRYVFYKTQEGFTAPETLYVKAIDGGWQMTLPEVRQAAFTDDSRKLICVKSGDSLCEVTPGCDSITKKAGIMSFILFRQGKQQWLACRMVTPKRKLVLQNLQTGQELSYNDVLDYRTSEDGSRLVLQMESGQDSNLIQSIRMVSLADSSSQSIWTAERQGISASNLTLNKSGSQLAFLVTAKTDPLKKSFWYYKAGTDRAVLMADDRSSGADEGLEPAGILRFSTDGSRLFVWLKPKHMPSAQTGMASVDVWSYFDAKLQSQQLSEEAWKYASYLAVIQIDNGHILRLQQKGEWVAAGPQAPTDEYVVMDSTQGSQEEMNWSIAAQPCFYLVSTFNGKRTKITGLRITGISPDGKYLTGLAFRNQHPLNGELCSYNIATGKVYNISEAIPVPEYENEDGLCPTKGISQAAWMSGEKLSLLVYDPYDVWLVDPSGNKKPEAVTGGFGRKHLLVFHLPDYWIMYSDKIVEGSSPLLLTAFDCTTKDAGFYRCLVGGKGDPKLLTMGPYDYNPGIFGNPPVKARDVEVYLVKRCSASASPNYFWTRDFKQFMPVSSVYPEKKYNWLTTELISFKTQNGQTSQAIVYKPENFDPAKKYPVILYYYERKSDNLNLYPDMYDRDGAPVNVAWQVSHGYLVVTPDIHYQMGKNGACALDAVLGVRDYLTNLSWVDTSHIGIVGHSFGSYETNYIVTHTTRFAAAVSSSGISDLTSDYGNNWGFGVSKQGYYQNRQGRINTTLWETPEIYIKNSPIFFADKITTPMLLVANKDDGNVSFSQGLALFLALRRLGKNAWMLQYDGESHKLEGKALLDFTIRSQQFFDHYLKGAPFPKWMAKGIPAERKGIEDGLELDYRVSTPGPGLLMKPTLEK